MVKMMEFVRNGCRIDKRKQQHQTTHQRRGKHRLGTSVPPHEKPG
jgi:hypothetical protein